MKFVEYSLQLDSHDTEISSSERHGPFLLPLTLVLMILGVAAALENGRPLSFMTKTETLFLSPGSPGFTA